MSFVQRMLVVAMTAQEAYKLLDIDPSKEFDLKSAYRKAALKNHPDHGGNEEKMKLVNNAYDLLGKMGTRGNPGDYAKWKAEREAKDAEWVAKSKAASDALAKDFDVAGYQRYFEEQSGKKLKHRVVENRFDSNGVNFRIKFEDADKETVFDIRIYIAATGIQVTHLIGSGDGKVSYSAIVNADLLHEHREEKMKQQRWSGEDTSAISDDPKKLFPPAKLKKVFSGATKSRKFSKRDFLTTLFSKLRAQEWQDNTYGIPLDDEPRGQGKTLVVIRSTYSRMSAYSLNGIYDKSKRILHAYGVIPETEEGLAGLVKAVGELKKVANDPDKLKEVLNNEVAKLKDPLSKTEGKAMASFVERMELLAKLTIIKNEKQDPGSYKAVVEYVKTENGEGGMLTLDSSKSWYGIKRIPFKLSDGPGLKKGDKVSVQLAGSPKMPVIKSIKKFEGKLRTAEPSKPGDVHNSKELKAKAKSGDIWEVTEGPNPHRGGEQATVTLTIISSDGSGGFYYFYGKGKPDSNNHMGVTHSNSLVWGVAKARKIGEVKFKPASYKGKHWVSTGIPEVDNRMMNLGEQYQVFNLFAPDWAKELYDHQEDINNHASNGKLVARFLAWVGGGKDPQDFKDDRKKLQASFSKQIAKKMGK